MIVSINQPAYLPWLGYFHRIALSDVHIVLDHVQFEKNSFVNRNKIALNNKPLLLTVPVESKGQFGNLAISTLKIAKNDRKWKKKHWNSIKQAYSKAPFFKKYSSFFEFIYTQDWESLFLLTTEINKFILDALSINTPLVNSSTLFPTATKSELVLELCKKKQASVYFSGAMGKNYLDETSFLKNNIEVVYQDYKHPVYLKHKSLFQSHLSILDLLFHYGNDSTAIIMEGNITRLELKK